MKMTAWRWHIVVGLLAALLAGCQTARVVTTGAEAPPTMDEAEKAERDGQYVLAAREYTRLATVAQPPQKQNLELRAIEALIKGGQSQEARSLLRNVNVQGLDSGFAARKRILEARLLSAEGSHERAIRLLDDAARARTLNPTLLADIHAARAQAELALNNPIGAVRNLIARDALIVGKDAITENQTQIWKILNGVPRVRLASERQLTADPILGGWIDLALIAVDHAGDSSRLEEALAQWRALNLKHPASESLITAVAKPAPEMMLGRIERVAVLLPLSSPYAVAAQAVRDGFLAMDAANTGPDKPTIKIYDTGADATQAAMHYQLAIKDGAQLVIGPLGRDAVDNVIRRGVLSVPTMLLSHTDDESTNLRYLFQFGLPPEQEARQAAERAFLDGHRQAAVLYPQNPWGERMMNAFVATWQSLGGAIVANQPYREEEADHSEAIKQMLNISLSFERKDRLEKLLKTKLPFDAQHARPRQDLDFIFLAADAKRGRAIKPQLNFYQVGRLPVYSTSHIFTGKVDPLQDTDLDGIVFGDMPWMLMADGKVQQLRQNLQRGWPNAFTDLDRLYALGVDSYAILPHLNRISAEAGVRFNGVTSGLSMDKNGRLQRSLTWARFNKGAPKLLDASSQRPVRLELESSSGS